MDDVADPDRPSHTLIVLDHESATRVDVDCCTYQLGTCEFDANPTTQRR